MRNIPVRSSQWWTGLRHKLDRWILKGGSILCNAIFSKVNYDEGVVRNQCSLFQGLDIHSVGRVLDRPPITSKTCKVLALQTGPVLIHSFLFSSFDNGRQDQCRFTDWVHGVVGVTLFLRLCLHIIIQPVIWGRRRRWYPFARLFFCPICQP